MKKFRLVWKEKRLGGEGEEYIEIAALWQPAYGIYLFNYRTYEFPKFIGIYFNYIST
ncbi:hypothetical protein GCM10008903_17020 [Clostridium cadaveris]